MIKVLNQISKLEYDERIFQYFDNLTNYYKQTIDLYELNKEFIKNTKINDILNGINEVVVSQLKDFEENSKYCPKQAREEAIKYAKNMGIETISKLCENYLENQGKICSEFVIQENLKNTKIYDNYIQILDDIYSSIINNNFDEINDLYILIIESSIKRNTDFRKAANDLYEFVNAERSNLENIIKIQVDALEDNLKIEELSEEEKEKARQILDKLIEAYQYLGKEIDGLEEYFKNTENKKIAALTKEELAKYLLEEGKDKYIEEHKSKDFPEDVKRIVIQYKESKNEFDEKIKSFVENIITIEKERIDNENTNNKLLETYSTEKVNFIDEFIECFVYLKNVYENQKEELEKTEYAEILKGINETIQIKIESLEESREEFKNSIFNYRYDNSKKYIIDVVKITEEMLEKWYSIPIAEEKSAFENNLKILEQEIVALPEFELYLENLANQKSEIEKGLYKLYVKFLKESLLFELTTYEEILNYSVSRLREEQDNELIKNLVIEIDKVNDKIDALLKKNYIEKIQPIVHEKFDAKQHEVLMAEKQEGFEKGEIIKTLNSGYKYKDMVIVRANIIAAR